MQATGREVTISFFDTITESTGKTLVSKHIDVPFRLRRIRASFAPGVNRLMTLRYFISPDKEAPTALPINGFNPLDQIGQVDYITGDDEYKDLPHQVDYEVRSGWIKVLADNTDVFQHTIDTQVVIELLDQKE